MSCGDSFAQLLYNFLNSLWHLPALSYFFYLGSAYQGYLSIQCLFDALGVGKASKPLQGSLDGIV